MNIDDFVTMKDDSENFKYPMWYPRSGTKGQIIGRSKTKTKDFLVVWENGKTCLVKKKHLKLLDN